jgi:16S rRNA G966 N2-methylase RsmD
MKAEIKYSKTPSRGRFRLAFLDPPYGQNFAGPEHRHCIVEEAAKAEIAAPAGLALVDERTYGDTRIVIFERAGEPPPPHG